MAKSWRHDEIGDDALLEEAILAYFQAEDAEKAFDPLAWLNDYPPRIRPAMQSFLLKHRAARRICQVGLWVSTADDSNIGRIPPPPVTRDSNHASEPSSRLAAPPWTHGKGIVAATILMAILLAALAIWRVLKVH